MNYDNWIYLKQLEEKKLLEVWIEKINHRGRKDKRLLVVSESTVSLFKTRAFFNTQVKSRSFSWYDITKISFEKQILELNFKDSGKIAFSHQKILEFTKIILTHLKEIFLEEEYPILKVDSFEMSNLQVSPFRPLSRLRSKLFNSEIPINIQLFELIWNYYIGKDLTIDFSSLGNSFGPLCPYALFGLHLDSTINSIIIPPTEGPSHWLSLSKLILYNHSINTISSSEKFNNQFEEFLKNLIIENSLNIQNLILKNSKITQDYVPLLSKIFENRRLNSLTLSNAITRKQLSNFLTIVENISNFSYLNYFCIEQCPNFSLLNTMHVCKSIKNLSFINCELDLIQIINSIIKLPSCSIETLDISGNQAFTQLKKNSKFPDSISNLILNNFQFTSLNIGLFFIILSHSINPINLSLSNIKLIHGTWDELFEKLNNCSIPTLFKLNWNGNPIKGQFFDFLEKCVKLKYLSIDNCIINLDDSIINDLSDFIATTKIEIFIFKNLNNLNYEEIILKTICKSIQENNYI